MRDRTGLLSRLETLLERIAAAVLLAVTLIVFADVGARYLFSRPFSWTYEFVGMYLMPALFYFALSSTLAARHHVAVDLLRPRMPRTLARTVDLLGSAATATVFLTVAGLFGRSALEKYLSDSVLMGVVQWPTWIPDAIVAIGSGTIVLRLAASAVGHAHALATGHDPVGTDPHAERDA